MAELTLSKIQGVSISSQVETPKLNDKKILKQYNDFSRDYIDKLEKVFLYTFLNHLKICGYISCGHILLCGLCISRHTLRRRRPPREYPAGISYTAVPLKVPPPRSLSPCPWSRNPAPRRFR